MSAVQDPVLQGILIAWATAVASTVSPGPALLATMGTAMSAGRRAGVALGLGVSCGSLTWGLLAILGLSTLLLSRHAVLPTVRVFGAVYLLYLCYKAFRSAALGRELKAGTAQGQGIASHFLRGLGIHLTNPKAILAWIAIIALGLKPGAPSWAGATILAGVITFVVVFYSVTAVAFSTPSVVRFYARAQRGADFGLAMFFLVAAWRLAT